MDIGNEPAHEIFPSGGRSSVSEIERITAAMRASERLCLLSAATLSECTETHGTRLVFIPSISRTQQNSDLVAGGGSAEHVTTSAQCIVALQKLVPPLRRFQIGAQERKELPFQRIETDALRDLDPGQLQKRLRDTVNRSLGWLASAKSIPNSPIFGRLHPFTAAHFLRSVAPSRDIYQPVWWNSLLAVLWFLNLRTCRSSEACAL